MSIRETIKEEVFYICNAYESGYGHGWDSRGLPNPYKKDSDEWQAWQYGYEEAERKRERKESEAKASE